MIYLNHLLQATSGDLQNTGKHTHFTAFTHDTRQLQSGELFVAIQGARGNGHDYLLDALHKGAWGVMVEAQTLQHLSEQTMTVLADSDCTLIVVPDTRLALQQYAQMILTRWHPTVIAVTGSVGKTSTKEAIATVLSSRFNTFRSWQNYNDLLGIPLSLGSLEEGHQYAVLELGCDHPGEIADLCRLVRPQIGVITNIQPVQLQYFSSLDHLGAELGTLLSSLPEHGHFFYYQQDPLLQALVSSYTTQSTTRLHLHPFYPEAAPLHIQHVGWDGLVGTIRPSRPLETSEPIQLSSHLLGKHAFATMLAAYQIGMICGLTPEQATQAIQTLAPLPGRLNPLPGINGARLLDDTHNASPASMLAGLTTLHTLTRAPGLRIAVLGDMLNLGSYEEEAHRNVGAQAATCVDYLITRGQQAGTLAEAARQSGLSAERIIMTASHEDAAQTVRHLLSINYNHRSKTDPTAVVLIKGSEETRMERVTEQLLENPWEAPELLVRQTPDWKKTIFRHADRPTWVEIDLNAIGSNTRQLKSLVGPDVRVLISLKADAYGHGAVKVAQTCLHNGASMLGVATVTEAIPLREARIVAPILVFGYVPLWQMREAIRLKVTVTLYSLEAAQALSHAACELDKTVRVHVKVDTGMARLGLRSEQPEEIIALIHAIHTLPSLELEGLYTHFAQADASDQTYSLKQLARFQQILALLEEQGLRPPIVHAANSPATLSLPAAHFDMVRPGIAIYGLDPSPEVRVPPSFRPALSFKTQVSQVKWVPANEGISYGSTYWTTRPTLIAILPVGYADGFRRGPQNWGYVLIHGQEAPILGRVCMDQCIIDVTALPQTRVGDEVVLIGRQGQTTLTAEKVAERLGTINYEVVAELLARVPRVD